MIWVSTGASFGPGKSSLHETVLRELGFARECANTHDRSSLGFVRGRFVVWRGVDLTERRTVLDVIGCAMVTEDGIAGRRMHSCRRGATFLLRGSAAGAC